MEWMRASNSTCPSCGSHRISRSHRRGLFERYLLSIVQLRPYRCNGCDARFFRFVIPTSSSADEPISKAMGKTA